MNTFYFDGHSDTPVRLWETGESLFDNRGQVALNRRPAGGWAQFFAFCLPAPDRQGRTPEEQFCAAYAGFLRELEANSDRAMLCTSAEQAKMAINAGKCAAFLSIEGAEVLGCDPGRLDKAYAMGVRMIAPTWNLENALSGTNVTGGGLTARGREFVRRAQQLGMLVDVSHISERAFWDICELAEKPIVASHSNASAQCRHPRNLTDDQFRALCQLGGTAGLNLYTPFLTGEGEASMEDVYRHADHFLQLDGDGHLAIGADFDGCDRLPEGITGPQDMSKLAAYLERRGIRDRTLASIFSTSLWKVVTQL